MSESSVTVSGTVVAVLTQEKMLNVEVHWCRTDGCVAAVVGGGDGTEVGQKNEVMLPWVAFFCLTV